MKTRIEIYEDAENTWRWRAKRKGRIISESGEGYVKRAKALSEMRSVIAKPFDVYGQDEDGEFKLLK